MSTAIARINAWWNARQTSEVERQLSIRVEALEADKSALQEQLETERVKNRIQEVELKQLAAVISRDLERVKAETAVLGNHGGGVVKSDLNGADVS